MVLTPDRTGVLPLGVATGLRARVVVDGEQVLARQPRHRDLGLGAAFSFPPSAVRDTGARPVFTSCAWVWHCVDDVRRRVQQDTLGHRGRSRDPVYGIRRVLRRRRDRLSTKARGRLLQAGLIAGDPGGEVTLAWTVGQDLYRLDDPDLDRARAEALIGDLRSCPIPELARLGRTLHAWRTELRPLRLSRRVERADREPQPEDQEHAARRLSRLSWKLRWRSPA